MVDDALRAPRSSNLDRARHALGPQLHVAGRERRRDRATRACRSSRPPRSRSCRTARSRRSPSGPGTSRLAMARAVGKACTPSFWQMRSSSLAIGCSSSGGSGIRLAARLGEGVRLRDARDAQLLLGLVVEGGEVVVADRPVDEVRALDGAQLAAQAEVDRLEPVEVAAHVHGAAADAVGGPAGVAALVLLGGAAAVEVRLVPGERHEEVAPAVQDLVVVEVGGLVVGALLQQHDLVARAGQLQRHRRAAGAGADDADVHLGQGHRRISLSGSRNRGGGRRNRRSRAGPRRSRSAPSRGRRGSRRATESPNRPSIVSPMSTVQ